MEIPEFYGPVEGHRLGGAIGVQIPAAPGIYIWRRGIVSRPDAVATKRDLMDWIQNAVGRPYAILPELSVQRDPSAAEVGIRSGFLKISNVVVGGEDLSALKEQALQDLCGQDEARCAVYYTIYEGASLFGPVLYVGETDDLSERVAKHVSGASHLLVRIQSLGLTVDDLHLYYAVLEGWTPSQRQLLEQILTYVLVSPLVKRAG